ncbi:MAG: AAA family ATPase [Acidobacteria bacterium]|jgi:energy-coupling factor transporter ATP-binding protein EcfA2|nr:AAA family ATPase [Acidobacteriota bacterium]
MKPKIDSLTIEHFRVFKRLPINGLGQINLITGKNNTGKSSILEALRILASDASPIVIDNILRYREEDIGETEEQIRHIDNERVLQISNLFHGFPQLSDKSQTIVILAKGPQSSMRLSLEVAWVSEERSQEGQPLRLVPLQANLFGESEGIPALIADAGGEKRILTLDYIFRTPYRARPYRLDMGHESSLPCVFVSSYGGERTAPLGILWDKIALSDLEKDVVEALRIIDPEISAVSMVGGRQRTAIVRAGNLPRPVSLRSFGDGLNRLFGIVLSLVNAKNGILLIDEFENGMHHSVQLDVWRSLFKLSQRLDVQVFATSHSWDAVETFQEAAAESPGEGVLIRLSRKGDDIIPTIFAEDELAIATRDHIEVR